MGWLGYESSKGTGGQSFATSYNMCWLVAALYVFSGILQFIGIAFIYNLDKKTLAKMSADLKRNVEADDLFMVTTAEDHIAPLD